MSGGIHTRNVTFLFTDIESSTQLWEQAPQGMRTALACHDALARKAVESNHGSIVKMTGDGVHAAFDDPRDAISATLQLQMSLANPEATGGVALRVRCGLHQGIVEHRDNDFFGPAVNRAARVMGAANGGQVLLSQALVELIRDCLPPEVSLRDLGSVRLRDLTNPEHVYQIVHPQLRQDFPALRSLESTPNNLPQQLTSFIGRGRELVEARQLLRDARLLTLTGTGGIGKTRMSLQLGADVMDDYPDGVWFVELSAIVDGSLVSQAAAAVLGVKENAGRPVEDALVKYLESRQLLLILDNCEHLVLSCAELTTQLLRATSHVKILTSSREHLRVAGESVYTVPGLALPDSHRVVPLGAVGHYEAMRLFIDRAVAAQPAFQTTDKNATAIADICIRLDGIPLAIELAAARVRALSVEEIATRLTDRFRLLARGDRTAAPRQQTLQALIDWSYELLTGPERTLLRRLAVFAGGWTLEAVEAVTAGGVITEPNVVDLLSLLVEKSLVTAEPRGARYRLLETVRQYAQERQIESGEDDCIRKRHLDYYLALAEQASAGLVGPDQGPWLARLDLEVENLLAAHACCDQFEEHGELGLRLVHSVKLYLIYRGLIALLHRVTVEALARLGARGRTSARCRALHTAGQAAYLMGRYDEAQAYLAESLAIAKEIGDKGRAAMVLEELGVVSVGKGDLVKARGCLEQALNLARDLGDKRTLASAINALAQLQRMEGELDAAERLYEQMLALARDLKDQETIAIGLLNLAMVAIGRGLRQHAQTALAEALVIAEEIGSKRAGQCALEVSAALHVLSEEWGRAAVLFGAAEAQLEQTGFHRDPTDAAFLIPLIARAREALGTTAFAAAEATGRALTYEAALAQTQRAST